MDGAIFLFFATTLEWGQGRKGDHRFCTPRMCRADNVNEAEYKTRHVVAEEKEEEEGCVYEFVEIDGHQLAAVLRQGRIPRIAVTLGEAIQLRVVSEGPYVAISHVCRPPPSPAL